MEDPQADWPAEPWRLSAPESYVLNYAGEGFGGETLKLAIKELAATGALRVEPVEIHGRLGVRTSAALTAGPRTRAIDNGPLVAVLSLFEEAGKQSLQATAASAAGMREIQGVLVADLARAARRRFGGFNGYRDRCVLPALVERGLMQLERRTAMGVVLSERKSWTDAGREAVDELERWLHIGREHLGDWVSTDPAKGLAYCSAAGAAIFLAGTGNGAFALLDQELRRRRETSGVAGDGASDPMLSPDDDSPPDSLFSATEVDGIDFRWIDFGLDGPGDLDAAFAAIDCGVDAAGGGDGGSGGDGGN